MNTKTLKLGKSTLAVCLLSAQLFIFSSNALAAKGNGGVIGGGGGDATELRVNEVRVDILSWIKKGGAKDLNLPKSISYGQYVDSMTNILQAKKVIIEFTEDKVLVNNVEKTCKGFFPEDDKAHIRCNILRFQNTIDSEQYKLIHHEYAGLVNIENNNGAASDYEISSQITDYLSEQKILKLAVKSKIQKCTIYSEELAKLQEEQRGRFINSTITPTRIKQLEILKATLTKKGYVFESAKALAAVEIKGAYAYYSENSMCVVGTVELVDLESQEEGTFFDKKCGILSALFETGKNSVLKNTLDQVPNCQ